MILIITTSEIETTTDHVIDWLQYYGANYLRLNVDELTESIKILNDEIYVKGIDIKMFKICWLRKFGDKDIGKIASEIPITNFATNSTILSNLYNAKKALLDYLFFMLSDRRWITHPFEVDLNKLQILYYARKSGLNVPETLISKSKGEINEFLYKNNNLLISKSISDFSVVNYNKKNYNFLTIPINNKSLEEIDYDKLYISLFQSTIEKEYELRVFFIFEDFFAMAIFSQDNDKTKLDYRNYDYQNPNRVSSYRLPLELTVKLKKFIKLSNLTSGSIDIIKEKDTDNYYFLEVNPVGQFSNLSYNCNYYIEKKIAKILIEEDERF